MDSDYISIFVSVRCLVRNNYSVEGVCWNRAFMQTSGLISVSKLVDFAYNFIHGSVDYQARAIEFTWNMSIYHSRWARKDTNE